MKLEIRQMESQDIEGICRSDHDDSDSFKEYLYQQLQNQASNECIMERHSVST